MPSRISSSGIALTAALVTLAPALAAQVPRVSLDASFGAKGGAQRVAFSAWRPVLGVGGRLQAGLGVRVSVYGGDPTSYTNRGTVQGSLAASVTIDPAVYALDAAVFADFQLAGGISLGANLDIIGVAGGTQRTIGGLTAKPQAFSYFRYGSADHGSLNSEYFVALRVAPRARLRAGLSHYVTDYIVTDAAAAGSPTSRYQRFETVPFVGLSLRL